MTFFPLRAERCTVLPSCALVVKSGATWPTSGSGASGAIAVAELAAAAGGDGIGAADGVVDAATGGEDQEEGGGDAHGKRSLHDPELLETPVERPPWQADHLRGRHAVPVAGR